MIVQNAQDIHFLYRQVEASDILMVLSDMQFLDTTHTDHSAGYFVFSCEKSGHSHQLYACAAGEQHTSLLCEHHFLYINLKMKLRMAVAGWMF